MKKILKKKNGKILPKIQNNVLALHEKIDVISSYLAEERENITKENKDFKKKNLEIITLFKKMGKAYQEKEIENEGLLEATETYQSAFKKLDERHEI